MLKNNLNEKIINYLPLIFLITAVAFNFLITSPLLDKGYNNAGDDAIHLAYEHELKSIILEEKKLFGWSYLYGAGAPIFSFRPPLFYFVVVGLHFLSFELLSLAFLHKAVIVLFYSLYPLSVYYMMNKFGFSKIACGLAALLSPLAISTFGNTIIAYFNFGVHKQIIAIFLLPIAIGKLHGIIKNNEIFVSLPFITALMYLSHPYICYMFIIITGLYLSTLFFYERLKYFLIKSKKIIIIIALGFMLLGFYLVPFFSSDELKRAEAFSSSWRTDFAVTMFTAEEAMINLFTGSLLDGGKNLGVQDSYLWQNINKERIPLLTVLLFIGLLFIILNHKKFEYMFFGISFLFSFLFIIGPDEIFFLNYIPFQNQFQYIHSTPWLELNVFAIGAIGLAGLFELSKKFLENVAFLRKQPLLTYLFFLIIVAALVATPMVDRYKHASHQVDLKNFDTKDNEIISPTKYGSMEYDFKEVVEIIRESHDYGRVYGNPKDDYEFFYMTILPYLSGKTNVINGAFVTITGGVNKLMIHDFREDTGKNYNLMKLFNVRYLLYFNRNDGKQEIPTGNISLMKNNTKFSLYKTKGNYGSFDFTEKPFLVYISRKNWMLFNTEWLKAYMMQDNLAELPFFIRATNYKMLNDKTYLKDHFSGILLIDYENEELEKNYKLFTDYLSQSGRVYSYEKLFDSNNLIFKKNETFTDIIDKLKEEYLKQTTVSSSKPSTIMFNEINKRGLHTVSIQNEKPIFVILKNSYYWGWKAEIDGKKMDNFEISPGYNSIIIPSGKYNIVYIYKGPNNFLVGILISLVALVVIVLLNRNKKLNKLVLG